MRGCRSKKSKLFPKDKAIVAAKVLLQFRDEVLDTKQAGQMLREKVGLQWTVLTAAQYLTGKEAMQALATLPPDWVDRTWTKKQMTEAVLFANLFCAQAHPKGAPMSAGSMVSSFRGDGEIGKLLQEFRNCTDDEVVDP